MPFSFLCDDAGTVQGISGITFPSGPFNGTTNIIGGLSNASIANWGNPIVKTRNFATDPSVGNCFIIAPTSTQGQIRVYAFSQASILTNLWRVPDASGSPIVPIGTTYSTINDVKVACGAAGVIYYDNNGIAVS